MKNIIIALGVVGVMTLTGCASDYDKYASMQTSIHTARATAEGEKYKAISAIGASGDVTAKVAAMFALHTASQAPAQVQFVAPKSVSDNILSWVSVLAPALVQGYGINANQLIATTQSNNSRDVAVSTNSTFLGMAGAIQAPAANMTISGSGVIGNGTYSSIVDSYSPIDNSNQGNPIDNSSPATTAP